MSPSPIVDHEVLDPLELAHLDGSPNSEARLRKRVKNGGADRATDASGVTLTQDVLGAIRPLRLRDIARNRFAIVAGWGLSWAFIPRGREGR
jgi:hypothetical protein